MIAEWRKLWRTVTTSTKVSKLSDQAALFWTWAIPYFSTHGFLEYEPEVLKSAILSRRNSMPATKIPEYVQEIISVGLWRLFLDRNGIAVLYDPRWFEKQNIRKDRMGQPPYNIKEMREVLSLLPDTPGHSGILQELKSICPVDKPNTPYMRAEQSRAEKSREDKDKESAEPEKHLSVDNSQSNLERRLPKLAGEKEPLPTKIPEKNLTFFETLFQEKTPFVESLCLSVIASDPTFNPYQWITMNKERNPDALIHSLKRLKDALQSKMGAAIKSWAYIESVIKDEDKNYNAREFDTRAQKDKADFKGLVDDLKTLHEKRHAEP